MHHHRLLLLLVIAIVTIGCSSDDDDQDRPTDPGGGDHQPLEGVGCVIGDVLDRSDDGLSGATVSLGPLRSQTDAWGRFFFLEVPAGDYRLTVEHENVIATERRITVAADSLHTVDRLQLDWVQHESFQTAVPWTIHDSGAAIAIPPSSFVNAAGQPYDGLVTSELVSLRSSGDEYFGGFPGPFQGTAEGGSTTDLVSLGLVYVTFASVADEALAFADGVAATLTFDLNANLVDELPPTLPLWWFDPQDGQWRQQGHGVVDGTNLVAAIDRVGHWTWTAPDRAFVTVSGQVLDIAGEPAAGVQVTVESSGLGYRAITRTDAAGRFAARAVVGTSVRVRAGVGGEGLDGEYLGTVVSDEALTEPLVVPAARFWFAVTWDDQTPDLDAHFYVPMTWDDAFELHHVSYRQRGSAEVEPFCWLGEDANQGLGPETLAGYRLREGRHQFWVNEFRLPRRGLPATEAVVHLVVGGALWRFRAAETPHDADEDTAWWHVCDLVVTDGVVAVDPVDRFGTPPSGPQVDEGDEVARGK
jgi:hypothetical protein